MKNTVKRILSATLAFVMVFLMVPFGVTTITATEFEKVESDSQLKNLGRGYNVLGDDKISSSSVKSGIFNNEQLIKTLNDHQRAPEIIHEAGTSYSYDLVTDMSSYIRTQTEKNSWNIGVNAKIKIVTVDLKYNHTIETSSSQTQNTAMQYAILKARKTLGMARMNLNGFHDLYVENKSIFTEDFLNEVRSIQKNNIDTFFDTYGTHILTGYSRGGEAVVTYKGQSLSTLETNSSQNNWEVSGSVGVSKIASLSGSYAQAVSASSSSANDINKVSIVQQGFGSNKILSLNNYTLDSASIDSFFGGVNDSNCGIVVDSNLDMMPIWDLVEATAEDGIADKAELLKEYYYSEILKDVSGFYKEYIGDDYEEDAFSEIEEWLSLSPDKVTIITEAEQLASIDDSEDTLKGIYVLANNIDLSEYQDWTPIGTQEAPFMGKFYGNYNTVKLNITQATNGYAGLFGYVGQDGLISNLRISGNISATADADTYIGAVAAYNRGTVKNCYDDVEYDIAYESIEDLHIPARLALPNGENTIVIGDEIGVRLSGSYTNASIVVEDNNVTSPAYIILEDATITGTICSDGDRSIYIISQGTANSITAPDNSTAVKAKGTIGIFGDAELTINGGKGTNAHSPAAVLADTLSVNGNLTLTVNGGDGNNGYNGWGQGNGTPGVSGGSGYRGGIAIDVQSLIIKNATVNATGGNGGYGGYGGDGNNKGGLGESGKYQPGGHGGWGGDGAAGIDVCEYLLDNAKVHIVTGNGGNGGEGGNGGGSSSTYAGRGGDGGRGGNSGDLFVLQINETSTFTYDIGSQGSGGSGGSSANGNIYGGTYGGGTSGIYYNGHYYQLIKLAKTWSGAKTHAESLGGHLVTITSKEENDIVDVLIGEHEVWLGATDSAVEGTWVWITGEEFIYENWNNGEPNNYNNQDYLQNYEGHGWDDSEGKDALWYICEWESYSDYREDINITTSNTEDINIFDGIICGYSDASSNISKINNESWDGIVAEIEEVRKIEYYSGATFDRATVDVLEDGVKINSYRSLFNTYCSPYVEGRMGYVYIESSGCERYIPVKVKLRTVESIEIVTLPQTQFVDHGTFDISGIEIKLTYNNEDTEIIGSDDRNFSYKAPSLDTVGKKTVTVYYDHDANPWNEGLKAQYEITVDSRETLGIEITNFPDNYKYQLQGTPLKTDGLVVMQHWNDGTSDPIDISNLSFDVNPSICTVGESTVTITFNAGKDFSETYKINVTANANFDHNWDDGEVSKEATHTEEGEMLYTCQEKHCGATKTEVIEKTEGHIFSNYIKVDEENHKRICVCGFESVVTHKWNDGEVTKEASHISLGEMTYTCYESSCGATKTEEIPKLLEHTYSENWIAADDSDHKKVCECGDEIVEEHTWDNDEGVVTLDPTYTEEGTRTYTCTACEYEKTESIPAIGIDKAPQFVMDAGHFTAGQTVKVRISLKNNPGVASLKLLLTYDTNTLTPVDITYNENIGGQGSKPQDYNGPLTLFWVNSTADSEGDFLFATVTFEVKETAVADAITTLSISYNENDICDFNKTNIQFFAFDSEHIILDYVPGDINGDKIVNNKDVTRLFQYLAEMGVEVNEKALDVNGDGFIDIHDFETLFQYMSGWDVHIE